MKSHHFRAKNDPFAQSDISLGKTINIIFMYLLASFTWIQGDMRTCHFLAQSGPFAPNENFFKTIKIISMYHLAPFIVQNFKKLLIVSPKLSRRVIFQPKTTRLPRKRIF